jgi:8-amino-7-oxononanoate synthase
MDDLGTRLEELREAGLERRMPCVAARDGSRVVLDGRALTLLCSNDYLGLADDPRVREAAAEAAVRWGAGAGASRLVSGNLALHGDLEEELADFKRRERCVLFGSGYLANTGIVAALAGRGQAVLSDQLNHASIIDGCRLARAQTMVYRHADLDHLEHGLRAASEGALIVTDGVFSMDGDVAPLAGIVGLARRYGARVMVDEAHATGALGPGGRGAVAAAGLGDEVDVVVGTLGKALGSYGAYACCDATTADWLVNTARTLIFSTALPPPALGAARTALAIVRDEPHRVERLRRNAGLLRGALAEEGLFVGDGGTQIVPVGVGPAGAAVRACERALAGGVFAQAIRPPTVPSGTSRLRLTAMATHTEGELRNAASVVADAVDRKRDPTCEEAGRPARGRTDRKAPRVAAA